MAWDINRVFLVCRLASDVELRYTQNGKAVADFRIAVGGRPRPDGTDNVSFFKVVVWGKAAENCNNYLGKGKQIALEGRLEQRSWQAQDGSKRSTIEIIADRIQFLSSPVGQTKNEDYRASSAKNSPQIYEDEDAYYDNTGFNPNPIDFSESDNDDVPF